MPRFLAMLIAAAALPPAALALDPPAIAAAVSSPAAQLAELVEADKAFAACAEDRPFPEAIGAMLAEDAAMPARGQPVSTAIGCRKTASENIAPKPTQVASAPTATTTQP